MSRPRKRRFLDPAGVSNLPALRKYDEAAREYDAVRRQRPVFPATEPGTPLPASTGRDEDYDESAFGLIADEILQYNAEIAYMPGEAATSISSATAPTARPSSAPASRDRRRPTQPLDDWDVDFDEITDTWGLGLDRGALARRWTSDVSGPLVAVRRLSPTSSPARGRAAGAARRRVPPRQEAEDFDNYEDVELLAVSWRLDYQINEAAGGGLLYRYEDYTIDSFILQGLSNYLPGALLINADNGDYRANVFGLDLRFSF